MEDHKAMNPKISLYYQKPIGGGMYFILFFMLFHCLFMYILYYPSRWVLAAPYPERFSVHFAPDTDQWVLHIAWGSLVLILVSYFINHFSYVRFAGRTVERLQKQAGLPVAFQIFCDLTGLPSAWLRSRGFQPPELQETQVRKIIALVNEDSSLT